MFILLAPGTDIAALSRAIRPYGVEPLEENGGLRLKGAVHRIDPAWLQAQEGVLGIVPLSSRTPLASRGTRRDTIVKVGSARFGGGFFSVIAGPCAVEDRAGISSCAQIVAAAGAQVLRGGAFKPRTSPYDYQGLGEEGVRLLREEGRRSGLPVVAELLTPEDCEKMGNSLDMVQIGTRNMQNYPLLKAAGRLKVPVLLKRGFHATQEEWLQAAEYILAEGNTQVILCERGIRTFDDAQRFTLDLGAVAAMKKKTHLPIIVDPSHAVGNAALVEPMALAAICAGCDGLMLEIHPNPRMARCDGTQALDRGAFFRLMNAQYALRNHLKSRSIGKE